MSDAIVFVLFVILSYIAAILTMISGRLGAILAIVEWMKVRPRE